MAERRMLTKKVTDDDNFLSLSSSAQALYLHLTMSADDDGFCNQVSISMFKAHASVQDLEALLEKRFVYQYENGVIVIKHWRMANALRKDRYNETVFQEELAQLKLKKNGAYTMKSEEEKKWLPSGCQVVAKCLPQDRLDKDRLDKINNICPTESDKKNVFQKETDLWNSLTAYGITNIRGIIAGSKRAEYLNARLKQYGLNSFSDAIEEIKHSDFLQGKHNGRTWQITFDWLIKPGNYPKVIEGNYRNADYRPTEIIKTEEPHEEPVEEMSDEEWARMVKENGLI